MNKAAIKEKIKDYSVMFVDDEQVVTEIMKNILPHLFKEVHYATNGIDGLDMYTRKPVDLIITDISMPQLNGIEMIEKIKLQSSDIKCIILSGHNEKEYLEKCQNRNCQYIIKPISSKLLYEAFDNLF